MVCIGKSRDPASLRLHARLHPGACAIMALLQHGGDIGKIPSSYLLTHTQQELRIHIPWTQLLSQPIEVKLYTIELILTARGSNADGRAKRAASSPGDAPPAKYGRPV